jgi:hypothetical protein
MAAYRRFVVVVAVAVAGPAGVACNQGSPVVAGPTPSASASVSPAVTTTTLPSPSPSASPALAEGRSFGYIKSVDAGVSTLVFDLAQFFTGEAANKAAQQDGVIGPGESVDNDYYIRNVNKLLRTVPIAQNVKISIVEWSNCCDHTMSPNLGTFAQAFPGPGPTDDFHGPNSSYWLTVQGGAIVKIEEQYLP